LHYQVFIIFYSAYGHTKSFAEKVKEGVDEAGAEGILYQVGWGYANTPFMSASQWFLLVTHR